MTIPLFFVADPELSTGLISIATNGEPLPLKPGSLNRNIPGMLVVFSPNLLNYH
jgi:hypothetical protein